MGMNIYRRFSTNEPTLSVQSGTVVYGGDQRRPVWTDRFVPGFAIHEAVPEQP